MLFGSEEQKQKWLPQVAKDHISAFLLTEPDVGSDPARLGSTATPTDGGYLLNGRKLWATNGAIADIVVVMAQVPKGEGRRGGISAFVLDYTTERRDGREPQRVHGPARDRELRHPARERLRAGGEPDRQGGHGPQDRPLHAQHGPPRAARDLRRQRQVGDQGRARVVGRARAVGPAGRQARRRRAEDRLHRGDRVRPGGDARRLLPPGRRQEERRPHRGRDREALRLRERLAGARRADADPRRPRLRDRRSRSRTAARSRCRSRRRCATCASTASSRARPRSCTC